MSSEWRETLQTCLSSGCQQLSWRGERRASAHKESAKGLKMKHTAEIVGRELKVWQAMGSSFGHRVPQLKFQCNANVLIQSLQMQQSWNLQDPHRFLHHSYGLGGDEGNVTCDMDVLFFLIFLSHLQLVPPGINQEILQQFTPVCNRLFYSND